MRLFVAAELSDALRETLERAIGRLERAGGAVRWTRADQLHLTLKFCGELDGAEALIEALRPEVGRFPAIRLDVVGLGQFPPKGPPRVIWAGCRGDVKTLVALAGACDRAAQRVGAPSDDHAYSPHITLGRVKGERNWKGLADAVRAQSETPLGALAVDRLAVIESRPGPNGHEYTALEHIALRAKPEQAE